jgi:hypothetical protein
MSGKHSWGTGGEVGLFYIGTLPDSHNRGPASVSSSLRLGCALQYGRQQSIQMATKDTPANIVMLFWIWGLEAT